MPNRTVYISEDDEPVWDEAQRLLPFYQNKSLSAFIAEKVREYVKEENARQRSKQRVRIMTELAQCKTAWAVGSWGEFDWEAIYAETAEEAAAMWLEKNDHRDCSKPETQRKPEWDGKNVTTCSHEWFRSGLGVRCDECGYETWPENGEAIIDTRILCEDCQPASEDDAALEDLRNQIIRFYPNPDRIDCPNESDLRRVVLGDINEYSDSGSLMQHTLTCGPCTRQLGILLKEKTRKRSTA
jgi:hypothetical protein